MAKSMTPAQRRWGITTICAAIAAISGVAAVQVPGGQLAFGLCFVGAIGAIYHEHFPRRANSVAQNR
jgi:hypothetical protein